MINKHKNILPLITKSIDSKKMRMDLAKILLRSSDTQWGQSVEKLAGAGVDRQLTTACPW